MLQRLTCASMLWIVTLSYASAQTAKTCEAIDLDPSLAIEFAQVVKDSGKVNFIKGTEGGAACLSASETCRRRAFLTSGDVVLVQKRPGDHVCAEFTSAKDVTTAGFLPASSLAPVAPPETRLDRWLGKWRTSDHQRIEIVRGKTSGKLSVSGEALYGADDPDRVKNGSVHTGDFSADASPRGPLLEIATDGESMKPFETSDKDLCKLRLEISGHSLLVEDNNNCGGANVSFSGTYTRR